MSKNFTDSWPSVFLALVCALLIFPAGLATQANAAILLRAGSSEPEGTTGQAFAIGKLCELATKLSNGELNAQPFYQSLGVAKQLTQAVMSGSVDIGDAASANLAPFTDAFLPLELPFLFKTDRDFIEFVKAHQAGKRAIAQFEKDVRVKTLLFTSHSYDAEVNGTDIQTRNKLVKVPADIKGLKLRTTTTPVEIALGKAYGANPSPVDWGQAYSALQQGVVDGAMGTPLPPYAAIKLYEVTKYYVALGLRHNLFPIYMNQKKFDSLTPFQQKALLDAAAQTEVLAQQFVRDKVKAAIDEVTKAGVQIYYPTKEEMAKWMSVRETVWQQVANEFKGKIDLKVADEIYSLYQH